MTAVRTKVVTEHFVDAVEVADYLGVSYQTVLRWAGAKQIPSYKLGTAVRFRISEIAAWAEQHHRRERAS